MSKFNNLKEEFDDLVRRYSLCDTTQSQKDQILAEMRGNLLKRNESRPEYTIQYASKGLKVNITNCDYSGLRKVAADMDHFKIY